MKGYVSVGSEVSYELHSALLVYKRSAHHGNDDVFITRHDVNKDEGGIPVPDGTVGRLAVRGPTG